MRVPIIAGNWKMHKTVAESVDFVKKVKDQLPPAKQLETALDSFSGDSLRSILTAQP